MIFSPDEPSTATTDPAASADLPAVPASLPVASLPIDFSALPPTEKRNPRTLGIDVLPTLDVLQLINAEDETVAGAVRDVLGTLAVVVDEAVERVRCGGRVHYFGAGSSGRIAMLDAAELPPTFGLPPGMVIAHLAGGNKAMTRAVEGAEDDRDQGAAEAREAVAENDVVIGLSASGRTPYVAGALAASRDRGAYTVVITSAPGSGLIRLADAPIVPETGPEAIAGSTRMKATTAMKLVLNSFSTALMIRLGKTYSNLMVEVSASNSKLRGRKVQILREASGAGPAECESALAATDGELRLAMVMVLGGVGADEARAAFAAAHTVSVRGALAALGTTSAH